MLQKVILSVVLAIFPVLVFGQDLTFSSDSVFTHIEHLCVTIGPRPMGSDAERTALEWAKGKFQQYGADSTFILDFSSAATKRATYITKSGTAVGIFKGETDSAIVVGGHIDSGGFEISGANDNASGAATTIELARLWSQRPRHFTMIFCAFGGEEMGLLGSRHFAENYAEMDSIVLMFSMDMTASEGKIEVLFERKDVQSPKWLVQDAFRFGDDIGLDQLAYSTHSHALLTLSVSGPGSDHKSFIAHGVPAIDFTAGIGESPIHTQQDHMGMLDKNVSQKYGDFMDAMVKHYQQNGIPNETNHRFVLWNLFSMRLFIPYWLLIVFNVLAILAGAVAFYIAFKSRIRVEKSQRKGFSGLKITFLFLLILLFAHMGETVVQVIKGYRFAWVGHLGHYWVLTFLWMGVGLWLTLRLSRNWKFNDDPATHALRTLIICIIYWIPSLFLSARFAIYPAMTLFLFSLATLVKPSVLKSILALIAPLSIYRLLFNEEFLYTSNMVMSAGVRIDSLPKALLFNTILTLIFFVFILPFMHASAFAFFSVKRRSWLTFVAKPATFIVLLVLIFGYSAFLISRPVYTEKGRPFVNVKAEYELPQHASKLMLVGNEYFKDVAVQNDTLDLYFKGRTHKEELPLKFNADWIQFLGETTMESGEKDTVFYDWRITSARPWIQTTLKVWPDSATIDSLDTNLLFFIDKDKEEIKYNWFGHFEDTLQVSGRFAIEPGANLIRKVTATYKDLPLPLEVTSALANIKYRTEVVYQDTLEFEQAEE